MLVILKIFILVLIMIICVQIGILKAKSYENRAVELKKIKSSLEVFRSKIEFTYEPIRDIFCEISKIIYEETENIFKNTVKFMDKYDVNNSWNMAVDTNVWLKNEDKSTIKMFGKLLGKTDKSGQINEINIMSKLLDGLIEKAESENNKNFKLFKSLGICVGIGICIILM